MKRETEEIVDLVDGGSWMYFTLTERGEYDGTVLPMLIQRPFADFLVCAYVFARIHTKIPCNNFVANTSFLHLYIIIR